MLRSLLLALAFGLAAPAARAQTLPLPAPAAQAALPDPGHPWTPDDYAATATALARAPASALPRRGTGEAGSLFARMVAPENLAGLRVLTTPLPARLALSLAYADATGKLLTIYLGALNGGEHLGVEVLALSAHACEIAAAEWTLVDIFLKDLKPSEPNYATRMQGLDRMREGTATVLSGVLLTLTETDTFGRDALRAFAIQVKSTFPVLMQHAPEPSQSSLGLRLETQAKAEPAGPYRDALEALLATVKPPSAP